MTLFRSRHTNHINPVIEQSLSETFSDHEMAVLSRTGTVVTIEPGQRFATEGSVGEEAVVVLSGTADVIQQGKTIATVGTGAVLGELALLTGDPRNASLVAHDELNLVVMSRREFDSLLAQCPRLAAEIDDLARARSSA